ncbi:hypothetical protein [Cellulosilyticum lentocellum]|uniref:Uncharacterized protein n=1 Tax=Cellulosilyticum lentocellum (strain ATCC 49066 / DSM 5427 / NCIMB 11756 / RHM5) TaxID=642492 RepID=F2JQ54_CELLD|nr:hypothetical protein [Cellulosilyticum lentocellum]ADZ82602.1 hypothetical protein Clole_0869 [Cellulosilyticum lentocellum DSM 5427]
MKLLNIKSIEKALTPWEYLRDLKHLRKLAECDECTEAIYAFNYGRIIGIQQERARRRGEKYEKAFLVGDLFLDLYEVVSKGSENIPTEDLDDYFEYLNDYVNAEMRESVQDKVRGLLKGIKELEFLKRKEANR